MQQRLALEQQIQTEAQAIFTAGVLAQTAKTLENRAIELEIKKQQFEQQTQANYGNYENFPLNSPTNGNFGMFSKGPTSRFAGKINLAFSFYQFLFLINDQMISINLHYYSLIFSHQEFSNIGINAANPLKFFRQFIVPTSQ